jgi:hypothetical protein
MTTSGIRYRSSGGHVVDIPADVDCFSVMGVRPGATSMKELKGIFRDKINTADRQQRAMVSLAYPMACQIVQDGRFYAPFSASTRVKGHVQYDASHPMILAMVGQVNALSRLVDSDPSLLETVSEWNESLLYIASRSGYVDVVTMLLSKGCRVNLVQKNGSTPLHAACYFGHEPLIPRLVACGAELGLKNAYGNLPTEEAKTTTIRTILEDMLENPVAKVLQAAMTVDAPHRTEQVDVHGEVVLIRLARGFSDREGILRSYRRAWHGTKYQHLLSIFQNGLKPPGSVISSGKRVEIPKGHIRRGVTVDGTKDWADAIFCTPSLAYACHACYAQRVAHDGREWCCVVEVAVRPGTFSTHSSTVLKYNPLEHEPRDPEMRIVGGGGDSCTEPTGAVSEHDTASSAAEVIRVKTEDNVVILGIVFVSLSFIENTTMDFHTLQALLQAKS